MHMQRQHRQREADDQKSDRDDAHDRQHGGHRTAVSDRRAHGAAPCSTFLVTADCARAFGLNRIRSFRGRARAGGASIV